MTKAEVILNAVNDGASDEDLAVLDATPEEQFETEEVKEAPSQANATVDGENTAFESEGGSSVTPETKQEVIDESSWKTDKNLTKKEITKRNNDFIATWKEINQKFPL